MGARRLIPAAGASPVLPPGEAPDTDPALDPIPGAVSDDPGPSMVRTKNRPLVQVEIRKAQPVLSSQPVW